MKRWYFLFVLIVAAFSVILLWGKGMIQLAPSSPSAGAPQPPATHVKGSFNGVPLAIPVKYIEYPITYKDRSDWESPTDRDRLKIRDFSDAIQSISLLVHWPSMSPRALANGNDLQAYKSRKYSNLVSIFVRAGVGPESRPPHIQKNGNARLFALWRASFERQSSKFVEGEEGPHSRSLARRDVGLNKELDLQQIATVGRDSDKPSLENYTVYWKGNPDGIVETLIRCSAGNNITSYCEQESEIPELGADLTIRYSSNLLKDWKAIESNAKYFVSSFQVISN